MFRAEIHWSQVGPLLKMEGKLAREWAEHARTVVTNEVVPKNLIVDMTGVSFIDCSGEELLIWLASREAKFLAGNVYVAEICDRLQLPLVRKTPSRSKRRLGSAPENALIAR